MSKILSGVNMNCKLIHTMWLLYLDFYTEEYMCYSYAFISSDRSSCSDDGLLYIYIYQPTFSDFHSYH